MLNSRIQVDTADGGASHVLVSSSTKRYRLIIYPPNVGTYTISNEPIQAGGKGIVLTPTSIPYDVCLKEEGTVVGQTHYISLAGGANNAAFIEVLH